MKEEDKLKSLKKHVSAVILIALYQFYLISILHYINFTLYQFYLKSVCLISILHVLSLVMIIFHSKHSFIQLNSSNQINTFNLTISLIYIFVNLIKIVARFSNCQFDFHIEMLLG